MKNKIMKKRFLSLMLSSCMLASVLTGCGKESEAETKTEVGESVATESSAEKSSEASKPEEVGFDAKSITEGVTLTIAAPADPRIADYEDNDVTRIFEEKFGRYY